MGWVNLNDIVNESFQANPLPISSGGTGASSAEAARENLGIRLDNLILWSGAWYGGTEATITLNYPVSAQPHGIVLAFSGYGNNGANDTDWSYFFVPKHHILTHEAAGINFGFIGPWYHMGKYLYISDTSIRGHSLNSTAARDVGGATVSNTTFVLRYVIGV